MINVWLGLTMVGILVAVLLAIISLVLVAKQGKFLKNFVELEEKLQRIAGELEAKEIARRINELEKKSQELEKITTGLGEKINNKPVILADLEISWRYFPCEESHNRFFPDDRVGKIKYKEQNSRDHN